MGGVVRAFRTPLVASAFLFFWGGAVVLSWTIFPLITLTHPSPTARRRLCQRIVQRAFQAFHGYMRALGLVREELVGANPERPSGPFVMVANHPTLVDVTAILANYSDVCCIVKSGYLRSIFVGRLMRFCGHIDGGNGEAMAGAAVLQEARRRLDEGQGVLIFPEGGRSPARGLGRFRRGAFELAIRANVPLLSVFITCDPPALSRGLPIWKHPDTAARLELAPQPLVLASSFGTDSRELCRDTEVACRRWLDDRGLLDDAARGAPASRGRRERAAPRADLKTEGTRPLEEGGVP
jgi:1-acyl-sn-glycerol-3-phosphate acyltransferase